MSSDSNVYKKNKMKNLTDNPHYNNYPESMMSTPRNLDWMTVNNTRKLKSDCLPYVKGLAKKIQKIC